MIKLLKKLWNKLWGVEIEPNTAVEEALEVALDPQPEIVMSEYTISNHPGEYWSFKWKELVSLNVDLKEAFNKVSNALIDGKKLDWYWLYELEKLTLKAENTLKHYGDDRWYRTIERYENRFDNCELTVVPLWTYNDDVAEDCRYPLFVAPVTLLLGEITRHAGILQVMVKGRITNNPAACKIHSVRFKSKIRRRPKPEVEMRVMAVTEALDEKYKCKKTVERLINEHLRKLHNSLTEEIQR